MLMPRGARRPAKSRSLVSQSTPASRVWLVTACTTAAIANGPIIFADDAESGMPTCPPTAMNTRPARYADRAIMPVLNARWADRGTAAHPEHGAGADERRADRAEQDRGGQGGGGVGGPGELPRTQQRGRRLEDHEQQTEHRDIPPPAEVTERAVNDHCRGGDDNCADIQPCGPREPSQTLPPSPPGAWNAGYAPTLTPTCSRSGRPGPPSHHPQHEVFRRMDAWS